VNLQFVVSGLGLGSVYALSGVSLVVLYRASGTLNFAIGALGALGAHCAWTLLSLKYPPFLAIAASIVVAAAGSFLYGRFVAPALSHRDRSVRAVSTLGFALVLLGFMGLLWGETIPRRLILPSDAAYVELLSVRVTYTRVVALALALGTVGAIALLLFWTRIGLAMRSLASNRELGGVLGINTTRVDSIAWLISGAIAGASGLLLGDLARLQPTFLTFLVIPAVAAALLGGLTSLGATLIGGLVIGMVEGMLTSFSEVANYRSAAPFLIALLFVAFAGRNHSLRMSQ
jgi:branched-chain amino acid transport system permease protein